MNQSKLQTFKNVRDTTLQNCLIPLDFSSFQCLYKYFNKHS